MKPVSEQSERGILTRFAIPVLCAVAGGYAFVVLMPDTRYVQILTVLVFGLWAACLLHTMGLLTKAAFLALGFAVIINPRKYFGMPAVTGKMALSYGQAAYQFISLLDLALFALCLLLLFGQFSGGLRPPRPILPKWARAGLIGYAAIAFASCSYAPSFARAIAQIVFDGKLVLMLLVLSHLFSDRERVRTYLPPLLYGLLAGCALEVGIIVLEYGHFFRGGSGNFLGIPIGKSLQEQMAGGPTMFRIAGTYGHANNLGAAMAVAGLLIWELQLAVKPILKRPKMVWAIWVGISVVILLAMSRGAWVALLAAAAFYFPCTLKIQGKAWLHAFLKRYALISIFAAGVLIAVFWQPLERRLFESNPGAIESRTFINDASRDVVAKYPLFGGGIGNHILLTKNDPYIMEITRMTKAPLPAHIIYLYWMTEVGIVGAFFYLLIPVGIFFAAVRQCLANARDTLTPVCLAFANTAIIYWITDCFSPVTRQIDSAYLYWLMLGVATGTQRLLGEEVEEVVVQLVEPLAHPPRTTPHRERPSRQLRPGSAA